MVTKRGFSAFRPSGNRLKKPSGRMPLTSGVVKLCIGIAAALAAGSAAFAQDEFQISGTYRQGRPCRDDDASSRKALVTITAQQITHPGGVCTIDDKRRQGNTVVLRTTCRDRRGKVLSGDVSFTVRDGKTLEMTAQNGSYTAILNRCEPSTQPRSASHGEPAAAE